jgi:membrane associated rhomboid family serine protease
MFPVSDVIPSRSRPVVTIGLIALNVIAFFYELQLSGRELRVLAHTYGVVPAVFDWTTVFTSLFLHAGWLHLGGNMLYLWIFGDNVEDRLGRAWFAVFYAACGAAAALAQVAINPRSAIPMIGASGAVAGVMGAYLVLYPHSRVLTAVFLVVYLDLVEIPAIFFLGIWFLMQLFSGVGSLGAETADGEVAFFAHVGGFVTGAATGVYLRLRERSLRTYWGPQGP